MVSGKDLLWFVCEFSLGLQSEVPVADWMSCLQSCQSDAHASVNSLSTSSLAWKRKECREERAGLQLVRSSTGCLQEHCKQLFNNRNQTNVSKKAFLVKEPFWTMDVGF